MAVTMQEVSEALAELGKLRFGEMRVEDAMHDIVRSTHADLRRGRGRADAGRHRPPAA